MLDPDGVFRRYQDLHAYVGWSEDEAARAYAMAPLFAPRLPALVDDGYTEISRHDEAHKVITAGPVQNAVDAIKARGKGLGRSGPILDKDHGSLHATSKPGRGTTFTIRLRAVLCQGNQHP